MASLVGLGSPYLCAYVCGCGGNVYNAWVVNLNEGSFSVMSFPVGNYNDIILCEAIGCGITAWKSFY